ncbi:hypothetical protein [Modestobacter sp. Leaf380]|nr:hypothetical protein [Modestobacter sp. Leaf380]
MSVVLAGLGMELTAPAIAGLLALLLGAALTLGTRRRVTHQ